MKMNVVRMAAKLFIIGLAIIGLLMLIIGIYSIYVCFTSGIGELLIGGLICLALASAGLSMVYLLLCKCF